MKNLITFPNLGLEFLIDPVAITIGPKPIYWYGIIIAMAFLFASIYAMKRSEYFSLNEDIMLDTVLVVAPLSIICARLYYVIFSLHLYDSFWDIFKVWEGGMAIYGGVIGGAIALYIASRWKKVEFLALLDIGACSVLLGQAIGRWGNFVNAEAYGAETNSWLMMTFGGDVGYHPTFLYESLWNFTGFIMMYVFSKKMYTFRGQMALIYLSWYGFGRGIIEGLRTDSLYIGNFRVSQLLGFATYLVCSGLLIYFSKKPVKSLQIVKDNQGNTIRETKMQEQYQNLEKKEEEGNDVT